MVPFWGGLCPLLQLAALAAVAAAPATARAAIFLSQPSTPVKGSHVGNSSKSAVPAEAFEGVHLADVAADALDLMSEGAEKILQQQHRQALADRMQGHSARDFQQALEASSERADKMVQHFDRDFQNLAVAVRRFRGRYLADVERLEGQIALQKGEITAAEAHHIALDNASRTDSDIEQSQRDLEQVLKLQKENQDSEEEVRRLRQVNHDLLDRVDTAWKENQGLVKAKSDAVATALANVTKLKTQVSELRAANKALVTENSGFAAQVTQLRSIEPRLQDTQEALKQQEVRMEQDYNRRLAALKTEEDESAEKAGDSVEIAKALHGRNQELEEENTKLRGTVESMEKQLEYMDADKSQLLETTHTLLRQNTAYELRLLKAAAAATLAHAAQQRGGVSVPAATNGKKPTEAERVKAEAAAKVPMTTPRPPLVDPVEFMANTTHIDGYLAQLKLRADEEEEEQDTASSHQQGSSSNDRRQGPAEEPDGAAEEEDKSAPSAPVAPHPPPLKGYFGVSVPKGGYFGARRERRKVRRHAGQRRPSQEMKQQRPAAMGDAAAASATATIGDAPPVSPLTTEGMVAEVPASSTTPAKPAAVLPKEGSAADAIFGEADKLLDQADAEIPKE